MRHLRFNRHHARKLTGLMLVCLTAIFPFNLPTTTSARALQDVQQQQIPVIAPGAAYRQTNLVSDVAGLALIEDKLLVNPWGISLTATSPFWVANAGSNTSTLYRGDVGGSPLTINPGLPSIDIPGGLPTGTVANTTNDFAFAVGAASGPARFIFSSITGNIVAWNPNVPTAGSRTGVIVAHKDGAVYTGLAIGNNGQHNFLYAANVSQRRIDVFASNFVQLALPGNFTDPALPSDYSPFNIQALGGKLYVAYAKINPMTGLDIPGAGNGIISTFDFNGNFLGRLVTNGPGSPLSSPWGMTIAPASFGIFANALLVGNFEDDGRINAFNPSTGAFLGALEGEDGTPIENDFLWALTFGNGGNGGDPNALYFTAGLAHETHGLFGSLRPTTSSATSLIQFAGDEFSIGEGGSINVTVTRLGDVSGAATVNYGTFDAPGSASQKSDYEIALGTLHFAPGETSKTFKVFLIDDNFNGESGEHIYLALSNPTGTGVGLGSPDKAEVEIVDNDTTAPTSNPLDAADAQFFVRQHYLDFLNREPDAAGLAFWTNQITSCGTNTFCRETRKINTSAAFFLSIEFQQTGFLVYLTHKAAFGTLPRYAPFMRDTHAISRDVVVGEGDWQARLEANKQDFFETFITRPEFVSKYPSTLTNQQYVDNLLASAGLSPSQVRLFIVNMTNAQENPPANPTSSNGGARPASFGTARLQFNEAQTAMTFSAIVNNMDFTGSQSPNEANDNLLNAHIHAGAAVTPTTNGPVVWGFLGNPFNDNNPNDQVVRPFTSGVGGTVSGKWDAPEGNNTTLAAQLANLREGRAYVNFHSTQFPGGEIRGNIPAATAFRDSLVAGLNDHTETRATVLRKVAEAEEIKQREFNAAFVLMQYFGYLRRNPDDPPDNSLAGYNFWLNKLNQFNGDFVAAEMVKAFITSAEYRSRFGPS
ncbi:MAG TPA: TIGR03118 family protein [Pyrinomonadaceae bacterium]|jgi:uncharacterized protein (TIGR03118 family)